RLVVVPSSSDHVTAGSTTSAYSADSDKKKSAQTIKSNFFIAFLTTFKSGAETARLAQSKYNPLIVFSSINSNISNADTPAFGISSGSIPHTFDTSSTCFGL